MMPLQLPGRETLPAYPAPMPRRESPPPKDFAFDFTASWWPHASIVPGSEAAHGWTLHGTVTKNGHIYGLAYRSGLYAACTIHGLIFELSSIERSRIAMAVEFKTVPGMENAPAKPANVPIGLTGVAQVTKPSGYSRPPRLPEGACDACGSLCYVWKQLGTSCAECGIGQYQPAHLWHFVQWPDGTVTATPADSD